jgi:hypothetical protein
MVKMIQTMLLMLGVLCSTCLYTCAQGVLTPTFFKWEGDGSGADYQCTTGVCHLSDEIWFHSFSVSSGATVVNTGGNGPLIIRSTGTCTIAGAISSNGSSLTSGITGNGDFGGGGGGGGGGVGAGANGRTTEVNYTIPIVNGGAGGTAGGGSGHNGVSTTTGQYRMFLSGASTWPGGGGAGGIGSVNGKSGGFGGAPVIFVCDSINFTGTIDVSGGNGANASANGAGGGGGGGGGYVVLAAATFIANTGTINSSGGTGGTCGTFSNCGAGGNGGNGWNYSLTIK